MKRMTALVFACLAWHGAAAAGAAPADLVGTWVEPIPSACGMVLQFKADGTLVRTTGELSYTTLVDVAADGDGWALKESLKSDNGGKSCLGETAAEVTAHLRKHAYVELKDGRLSYFRAKGERWPLRFVRGN